MAKGTTIGSAYVQILPSAEGIQGRLTNLLNQEAGTAGLSAGSALSGALGKALTGLSIAGAAKAVWDFGSAAVDAGKEFDSAMSQVAATMGVTTGEIGALRDFAQEMGANTAFSATQAAEALNYMALAGYDAETSMSMLPTVLDLAAAGGMDLARASDMITDSQSALGLSLEETSELVDMMAAASSRSNTSVEQLGDAILTIGGTANTMSGGTLELATALGILADNGIKGAEGGTHLRNIILSLSAPTDTAAVALENLGVQTKDADGDLRSLDDIMADLGASLDGLGAAEKAEIISTIFNKTDISSVNALLNTSRDRWVELGGAIEDSAGAAEKMANTQLDNLAGDVTLFESALEGAKIALSDELTPALRDAVEWGTEGMGRITEAIREGGVMGAVSELGELLGEAVGTFFANLPEIAWEAAQGALNAVLHLADGINKGLILSGFDEDVFNAQDLAQAYENVISLQEQLNTVTSQHLGADMAASYRVALEEASEHLEELRGNEEARIGILEQVAAGTLSYKDASDVLGTSIDNVAHMLVLQKESTEDAAEAGDELAESLEGAAEQTDGLIDSQGVLIGLYPAFQQALEDAGGTVGELTEWLEENEIELEDWQKSVSDATGGVINSFQKVGTSMDMTLEEMAENLTFNIRAHQDWQENLGILMDAAVESGDAAKIAFVQHMEAMGVGAAEQVALMVEDVDTTLDTFGPLFEAAAIEGIAGMTDGIDSGSPEVQASVSRLILESESAGSGAYGSGMRIGELLAAGVAAGMTKLEAIGQVQAAASTVVSTARSSMESRAIIASPSKLFRDAIGQQLTLGVAEGMVSEKAREALHQAAGAAVAEARQAAEDELAGAKAFLDLFAGGGSFNAFTDYSEQMLQAGNLTDFFRLADLRDEKIAGLGIDLEAEGWRTTAELLTEWMEANGAEVQTSREQVEELIAQTQEAGQTTTEAVLDRLDQLSEQLAEMVDTIASLRLVLDTGALVGEITPAINQELGTQYGYDARGI